MDRPDLIGVLVSFRLVGFSGERQRSGCRIQDSRAAGRERLEKKLAELFTAHPHHAIFTSFPGAGRALAPRLLAAWGSDRQRYETAQDMQRLSGAGPVTEQSGKKCWGHWRLACPKFLRQTFHEFAGPSILWSPWARAYYQQMRERGTDHYPAVGSLAFTWIRILYRCWKDPTLMTRPATSKLWSAIARP